MTDLRSRMRDALSEGEEERLSVDQVDSMRRVIVAAVRIEDESPRRREWLQPLALAATVVAMIGAGVAIGGRFDVAPANAMDDSAGSHGIGSLGNVPGRGARQLQFATPGGTRIIWIFNSDLNLHTTP